MCSSGKCCKVHIIMFAIFVRSGDSNLNIRKSAKEFISVLVDCGACLSRPHNIYIRQSPERGGKPPVIDGTTTLLGY